MSIFNFCFVKILMPTSVLYGLENASPNTIYPFTLRVTGIRDPDKGYVGEEVMQHFDKV